MYTKSINQKKRKVNSKKQKNLSLKDFSSKKEYNKYLREMRYKKNIDYIKSKNIIILDQKTYNQYKKMSEKNIKKMIKKYQNDIRYAYKYNYLFDLHVDEEYLSKLSNKSWVFIKKISITDTPEFFNHIYYKKLVFRDWLYIGYNDPVQYIDINDIVIFYLDYSISELKDVINDIHYLQLISESSSGKAATLIIKSGTKEEVFKAKNIYENYDFYSRSKYYIHRHNNKRYSTVTINNTYSIYDLLFIMASIGSNVTEESANQLFYFLTKYIKENHPDYFYLFTSNLI